MRSIALPFVAFLLTVFAELNPMSAQTFGGGGGVATPVATDPAGIVRRLQERLTEADPADRAAAAYALAELGSGAALAVPSLTDAIADSDAAVRVAAISALRRIGPAAGVAVPSLVAALEDEDGDVVEAASYALGRIGRDAAPAIPKILEILESADAEDRWWLARTLADIGYAIAGPSAGPDAAVEPRWSEVDPTPGPGDMAVA